MLENLNLLMPMEKKYGLQRTRTKPMSWLSFIVTFSLLRWTKVPLFHCKVCEDIDLTEKLILEKINNLDISKSPGPDVLHPRVITAIFKKRIQVKCWQLQTSKSDLCHM